MKWGLMFAVMLMIGDANSQSFVQVEGSIFTLQGEPYHFLGINFWYAMHLGSSENGDRDRLVAELDQLQQLGVTNLRIMAASEGSIDAPWQVQPALMTGPGEYKEHLWEGLDFVLYQMSLRGMRAVLTLNNFWPWSGGMAQYVHWSQEIPIPYPPPAEGGSWVTYMLYTSRFYTDPQATAWFERHIEMTLTRCNTFTGVEYRDDPTIMAWQLANEPRGMLHPRTYRKWIQKTADHIRALDSNHLISLGSEGYTTSRFSGNRPKKDHRFRNIDYVTAHVWVENWGWYDPQKSESYPSALRKAQSYIEKHTSWASDLGKPFVLEEFGMARDARSYDPSSTTSTRDQFYQAIFETCHQLKSVGKLAGVNVWSWSGNGRPSSPGGIWKQGDELIGDPPHEHQGWYSIYDTDTATLNTLRYWVAQFSSKEK